LNNAVTVIEPGTTKLSVLTCRKAQNGSLKLIGLGQVRYSGVQRDGWKSEKMLYHTLNAAIGQAQKMAGYKINRCMLGVPNEFCGLVRNTGKITPNHPISRQDLQELRKLAAEYPLPASWEISNVIYGDYLADGRPVDNPIGLSCRTLELQASIICIHTDFAKQLTKVLHSLNLQVEKWIPVPLACGQALLTEEDKENGVLLIDTGGECTDIVIYKDGVPVFYEWLPLGGNVITRDIAAGIGISLDDAEKLKRSCVLGIDLNNDESAESEMQMPVRNGQHVHNVSMELLQQIAEARIEEILELVLKRIQEEGLQAEYSKVILTGGGLALFRGIKSFAAGILNQPVQLGVPDVIGLSSPIFSAVYSVGYVGLNKSAGIKGIGQFLNYMIKKLGISSNFIL